MRYPKYLRFLDAFGCLGIFSAIAFVKLPTAQRPEEHLDGLWGNLTSEMVGIWLSVRLIDWIIRKHESFTKARVRIVRNMRFTEKQLHVILDFKRPYDLKMLYRELEWIESLRPARSRHLRVDEAADVAAFYAATSAFLQSFPNQATVSSSSVRDDLPPVDEAKLREELISIESARKKAEINILDETDEDDGM
ncbi:hypothetical protein [Xanthomonas arboricola]|uniref:hypothetical protein n=1 Tax=Xanthomonas arboricola TaxID=56448 RepID=UPI003EB96AD1